MTCGWPEVGTASLNLFVSDLHLSPRRSETAKRFCRFLKGKALSAQALFILGDLFDLWLGDDELPAPFNRQIAESLAECGRNGLACYFVRGNRDFLIDTGFAAASGARILPDAHLTTIGKVPTLLLHGDTLCTDDVAYQSFRKTLRSPEWQQQFLSRSLTERQHIGAALRDTSEMSKTDKSLELMDANALAVLETFRTYAAQRVIHGHTHRPARHEVEVNGEMRTRWVLGEWHTQAAITDVLACDDQGCRFAGLEFAA